MQRFHDAGPYHPDNCKKGYAQDNAKTAGVIKKANNIKKCLDFNKSDEDWDVVRAAFFPEESK